MFAIWVFKVPQHVSKSNNKKQFNGSFKPKDNTIDKQTNNYQYSKHCKLINK